jgi:hypothetical protein
MSITRAESGTLQALEAPAHRMTPSSITTTASGTVSAPVPSTIVPPTSATTSGTGKSGRFDTSGPGCSEHAAISARTRNPIDITVRIGSPLFPVP